MTSPWGTPEAEARAGARFDAALAEAERFFMGEAKVQKALVKICRVLDDAGIPFAIIGALALNARGYERVTKDVDLLLTRESLEDLRSRILGCGYVEKFPGSRGFRDADLGVAIDVVLAGDYPGDGKPKPVRFPDPATLARVPGHAPFLPVDKLVELKLASGLSARDRLKDLADVLELIKAAPLPRDLDASLDASVRSKYLELWADAQISRDELE
jgi:hypothetical protein